MPKSQCTFICIRCKINACYWANTILRHLRLLSFSSIISRKTSYSLLAWVCLVLAIGGAILPLLPTTPFLLGCIYFSNKVDAKLTRRLIEHPRFYALAKSAERIEDKQVFGNSDDFG